MVEAEELAKSGTAAQKRLLGAGDDMGKPLGLDPKWPANVINAVGNYGESFGRNVGQGSPPKLARGLMYAVPLR